MGCSVTPSGMFLEAGFILRQPPNIYQDPRLTQQALGLSLGFWF